MKLSTLIPIVMGFDGTAEDEDDEKLGSSTIMNSWAETKCGSCKETLRPLRIQLHKWINPERDGNKWDEKKRGPWLSSESRLIKILEKICEFGGRSDKKCSALIEANEEAVEDWYYDGADPSKWIEEICVKAAKHCCQSADQQGPNCDDCPRGANGKICSGNGKCDGGGDREIVGECKCARIDDQAYYEGSKCDQCPGDDPSVRTFSYFMSNLDKFESEVPACLRCDKACQGGCTAKGPGNCTECRDGYSWQFVPVGGTMNISDNGQIQGAVRQCVSLEKRKTVLQQKADATKTQKIFDPDYDIKAAQDVIRAQHKAKEERIRQAEKEIKRAKVAAKDEL